jgi:TPR repeat protein
MDELVFDESYFASAPEPLRGQLVAASRAYAARDYQRMLDAVAGANPDERRVMLVRGTAMIKSADADTFAAGIQLLIGAGKAGEPKAIALLGVLRLVGFVGYPQDLPRGRALLEQAVGLGDAAAARVVAMGYVTGWMGTVDPMRAVALMRTASDRGDLAATFQLGKMLEAGLGVGKDQSETERLMLKAAEGGYLDAQMTLGLWKLRAYSGGLTADPEPALAWLRRASERGQWEADYTLGLFHLMSMPTSPYYDPERGAQYLRKCAESTLSAQCTFAYATALEGGRGAARDRVQAYAFYQLSDDDKPGSAAKQRLKDLRPLMSREEIAQAEALIVRQRDAFVASKRAGATPSVACCAGGTAQVESAAGPAKMRLVPDTFTPVRRQ